MQWYNEPPVWKDQGGILQVTAGAQTDFWRRPRPEGGRDNGHFYYQVASGNFTAEAKFSARYATRYDQAGLMIRLDERRWMKCGVELFNGQPHISAVLTRDFSDWSLQPLPGVAAAVWVRVIRKRGSVDVFYSLDGVNYVLYRSGFLSTSRALLVGVMCAAPDGNGFAVTFENFEVRLC